MGMTILFRFESTGEEPAKPEMLYGIFAWLQIFNISEGGADLGVGHISIGICFYNIF